MSAIQDQKKRNEKFQEKSNQMAEEQLKKLTDQMTVFRSHLQEFATKHSKEIKRNPQFRNQFQSMCAAVGVDPLQSSCNFWTRLLGVGDFYYELAVQVIEVCMSTSHRNGGIMSMDELVTRVRASRNSAQIKYSKKREDNEISSDDILKSIEKVSSLGSGLKVIPAGRTYIIQSVASELSMDNLQVLLRAQESNGRVDHEMLVIQLKWTEERASKALSDLVMEGVVWIDDQSPTGAVWYWFPGLFK